MTNLYENIRKIRTEKSLTQDVVADRLGITQASYSRMEKGDTAISVDRLEVIADLFGMTTVQLLYWGEPLLEEEKSVLIAKIHALEKEVERLTQQVNQLEPLQRETLLPFETRIANLEKDLKSQKNLNKLLEERLAEKDQLIQEKSQMIEVLLRLTQKS
ncbi:helix-turn-helix domain-containing protein [Larkinella soli]|uniref:helix-turn-helix domain-containing protein n=1 Tax=Larkinella soli TaxID=1770527 RepID=UPI000FFC85F9|nr:helix-turn-helix transcriptional regulator [Larkinella soli]